MHGGNGWVHLIGDDRFTICSPFCNDVQRVEHKFKSPQKNTFLRKRLLDRHHGDQRETESNASSLRWVGKLLKTSFGQLRARR